MDEHRESDLPSTSEALEALQPPAAGSPSLPPAAAPAPAPVSGFRPAETGPRVAAEQVSTVKGIKETIESILIAFILAFVFRAFVVEAFVIPTGSMAPTLLGAHMRFTCRECGYGFDVGYHSQEREGAEIDIKARAERGYVVYCPNCKWKVPREESANPHVRYGDRILVLKYLYIPWVSSPKRWDVVVFKSPQPVMGAPNYVTNYIKRLIGLPGEWVMLLDGDIYVCTEQTLKKLGVANPREIPEDKLSEGWQIQRKPRHAQEALWRVVYDHDYRPMLALSPDGKVRERVMKDSDGREIKEGDGWRLPWVGEAGSGWDTGDRMSRVIAFKNLSGGGALRFDPRTDPYYDVNRTPSSLYFSDWLAYDVAQPWERAPRSEEDWRRHDPRTYSLYVVSDLKLAFSYHRSVGDGPLRAKLTKQGHEFVAEFAGAKVRLIHRRPDGTEHSSGDAGVRATSAASPVRVEFENVDHRVTLRLDGKAVLQTTDEQYSPDVKSMLSHYHKGRGTPQYPAPTVSIEAAKQEAELSHVSLWRDVYYTPQADRGGEIEQGSPEKPIKLGDGRDQNEYFVLGDNSAASQDSRYWTHLLLRPHEGNLEVPPGRVPGRFMLGKAFFVYWPAGYRPLSDGAPAVVPNFGEMRFID